MTRKRRNNLNLERQDEQDQVAEPIRLKQAFPKFKRDESEVAEEKKTLRPRIETLNKETDEWLEKAHRQDLRKMKRNFTR